MGTMIVYVYVCVRVWCLCVSACTPMSEHLGIWHDVQTLWHDVHIFKYLSTYVCLHYHMHIHAHAHTHARTHLEASSLLSPKIAATCKSILSRDLLGGASTDANTGFVC